MSDDGLERSTRELMGTTATVLLRPLDPDDPADHLATAFAELERVDRMVSRFLRTSAVQQLNAAGSGVVDEELLELLQGAMRLRRETDGAFDPTIHDALARGGRSGPSTSRWVPGDVRVDPVGRHVTLTSGTKLDLGAMVKGWAADRACSRIAAAGSVLVQVGNDIATYVAPGHDPWPVGLPGRLPTLDVGTGAVGISSQGERKWARSGADGSDRRHVIDPRTGLPAQSDVRHAVTTGSRAARCDAWATAAVVLGSDAAIAAATQAGIALLLERVDGSLATNAERASS